MKQQPIYFRFRCNTHKCLLEYKGFADGPIFRGFTDDPSHFILDLENMHCIGSWDKSPDCYFTIDSVQYKVPGSLTENDRQILSNLGGLLTNKEYEAVKEKLLES